MEEYEKENKQSRNVGDDLFFRAASSQVFSAQVSLTSVFGMGTGGPSPWKSPTILLSLVKEHNVLSEFPFGNSCVGIDLFSRAASSQVSSAQMSLTSVFGMGTGGPSSLKIPTFKATSVALVHLQGFNPAMHRIPTWLRVSCFRNAFFICLCIWCTFRDSNPGPTD